MNYLTNFSIKALRKLNLLKSINIYLQPTFNKRSIKLPIIGETGIENIKLSEPYLLKVIETLMKLKQGSFLDVGVNVGQTLLKFLMYEDGRFYYGFEPNPICVAYIEKVKQVNHLSNVHIIPVALSDHNGLTSFFSKKDTDSSASIIEGFRSSNYYNNQRYVPVAVGDEIIKQVGIDSVSVLKIDVEGGEKEVLTGLKNTIAKFRPFISCEILPVYDENTEQGKIRRSRTDFIQKFLADMNYFIFRLMHDGSLINLDNIETHGDLDLCEYLFIPKETKEVIEKHLKVTSYEIGQ